jgi:hypothetical protein
MVATWGIRFKIKVVEFCYGFRCACVAPTSDLLWEVLHKHVVCVWEDWCSMLISGLSVCGDGLYSALCLCSYCHTGVVHVGITCDFVVFACLTNCPMLGWCDQCSLIMCGVELVSHYRFELATHPYVFDSVSICESVKVSEAVPID